MKIVSLFLAALLLSACVSQSKLKVANDSSVAERSPPQHMCEEVMCQYNVHVVLKKEDGTRFDKVFSEMPVVQPDGVMVIAGQTVLFEANVKGSQLTEFKLVDQVINPEKTITAKLEQSAEGNMMLSIHNPFDKNLKISMGMMPLESDDENALYATSSCPVIAGGGSYEMWPDVIFQVWLGDLRLIDAGNMNCVE